MDVVKQVVHEKAVVIFSKNSCCISHSVKQLISSYGANPTVYELDEMPNGQEIEKVLKKMGCKPNSVPAVFNGERFVGQANEVISLQVQGNLVPMLMEAGAIWIWNNMIIRIEILLWIGEGVGSDR